MQNPNTRVNGTELPYHNNMWSALNRLWLWSMRLHNYCINEDLKTVQFLTEVGTPNMNQTIHSKMSTEKIQPTN